MSENAEANSAQPRAAAANAPDLNRAGLKVTEPFLYVNVASAYEGAQGSRSADGIESSTTTPSCSSSSPPQRRQRRCNLRSVGTVEKRNARERTRVHTVNQAFQALKCRLPSLKANTKRVSKLRILRATISYIYSLLDEIEHVSPSGDAADSSGDANVSVAEAVSLNSLTSEVLQSQSEVDAVAVPVVITTQSESPVIAFPYYHNIASYVTSCQPSTFLPPKNLFSMSVVHNPSNM